MASVLKDGQRTWSMTRDSEGHREYRIKFQARASTLDGPYIVLNTPGLYVPGAVWNVDNDYDPWAWCRPDISITPMVENEPNRDWEIEQTFSTKTPDGFRFQRCNDFSIEDPLLEPQRVNGSFVKYMREATHDRFGNPIITSSWEQVRGQQVEFDESSAQVIIEQNVPVLQLDLFSSMLDTVNQFPLWGMPPRTIKLSNAPWEIKYYGFCYRYYTRRFEFDINANGFDRIILDEGTKVLKGKWNVTTGAWDLVNIAGKTPDRFNPTHFQKAVDRENNPISTILDGFGKPWTPDTLPSNEWTDGGTATTRNIQPPAANSAGIESPTGVTGTRQEGGSLTVGKSYKYYVSAKSSIGETQATSGTAPITTNATEKKIKVTWNAVTDAVSYRVYREDLSEAGSLRLIAEIRAPKSEPGKIYVQKYDESDFLLLGIPTSF